jgi:lactate dehydrogenase-like 2-hydroxyacid dehydrogenase
VAEALKENGVKFLAMRCAGFDKVDVKKLNELDIKVSACLPSCLCAQVNHGKYHCIQLEHT